MTNAAPPTAPLPREGSAVPFPSVAQAVQQIRKYGDELAPYVTMRLEAALKEAAHLANEPPRSLLHGVPYRPERSLGN